MSVRPAVFLAQRTQHPSSLLQVITHPTHIHIRANMDYTAPPPPYAPKAPRKKGPASLTSLPLNILYYIICLTLDAKATPSKWASDPEEERIRRVWALFKGVRGIDRRFYLVCTSLLRDLYHPKWERMLPGQSTDAFPGGGNARHRATKLLSACTEGDNVFAQRTRETAIFDRFIAAIIGEELRRVESSLSEEGDGSKVVVERLQPAARLEDLLLHLPTNLIIPYGRPYRGEFPLPHDHLSINLTPGKVQMFLSTAPVAPTGMRGVGRGSKELICEIKRDTTRRGLDDRMALETVTRLGDELDDLNSGKRQWGSYGWSGQWGR